MQEGPILDMQLQRLAAMREVLMMTYFTCNDPHLLEYSGSKRY